MPGVPATFSGLCRAKTCGLALHLIVESAEQVTQQNAALVSQAASASQVLDNQAAAMTQLVNRFIV